MTIQTKIVLIAGCIMMFILCSLVIVLAVKGEKAMVKNEFIKGFYFWPDVYGDRVPIVARRYKIMVITFASSMFIFTLFCTISLCF